MKPSKKKLLLALTGLVTGLLLLASCLGSGSAARGWAGISELNNTLIFASMTGNIYAVDSTSGTVSGTPIRLVLTASGGLSCIPSCGGQQVTPIAIYGSPGTTGDLVIIGGYNGKVYAFPLVDGKFRDQVRWEYPPSTQGGLGTNIIGGLTVANDKVYFAAADGTVYALTTTDGYKEWSYSIGQKIWSTPTIAGDTLYIGSFDKKLYALNASTGAKKWEFATDGVISAPPVVSGNLVYFGSYDRHFYAVDAESGQLVWKFPADGGTLDSPRNWFWVKPVISGGTIYAPCLDGRVYALNASTGSLIAAINLGKPIASSPVVVGDSVIVAATDLAKNTSRVYAISTVNQQSRELTSLNEGIDAALFASGGTVYIHTARDGFYGLNVQNGARQQFSLTVSK